MYRNLKNEYYSLKEKAISEIKEGYCIIPKKDLEKLSEEYNYKLSKNFEDKEIIRKEYANIEQEFYAKNKVIDSNVQDKVSMLEEKLMDYERKFEDVGNIKYYFNKIIGDNWIKRLISISEVATGIMCFVEPEETPKLIIDILLM